MMSYMWIFLLASLAFGVSAQDLDLGDAVEEKDAVTPASAPEPVPTEAKKPEEDAGDLDLAEAANPETTPKPETPTAKPEPEQPEPPKPEPPKNSDDGGFDLSDAVNPDLDPKPEETKPTDDEKGLSDSDLLDIANEGNGDKPSGGKARAANPDPAPNGGAADQPQEAGAGQIAGIISGVGAAIIGAVTSYIAYQKKKLCFKIRGGEDPESGNKAASGGQSDPQVMSSLIQQS